MIKYLVLSGGGQNFFNYIGIFEHLFNIDYINIDNIKSIYGTSSGSIIATILCLKYEWKDIMEYVIERPWENKLKIGLTDAMKILENNGLYNENIFIEIFKSLLAGRNLSLDVTLKEFFEYSNIELFIYTFELNNFEEVELSYKSFPDLKLLDAVRMSCSIPLLIKPLCIDNKCYIDGGISCNYPVNKCIVNESCDLNEILGIKNFNSETSINEITNNSNIGDYFTVLIKRLMDYIKEDAEKIPNEVHLYHQGVSLEILIEALLNKEQRIKLINDGIRIAETYMQYKN